MRNIRVLIVEDQWIVSEEIKCLMEGHGCEVVGQSEDDVGAFEILKTHPVDVVLMDIKIKGQRNGIQLAEEILKHHQCAIIFLTAYSDEDFLEKAKKVKPAAFFEKPFDDRNLQVAVELAFNNLLSSGMNLKEDSYKIKDSIFIKDNTRFKKLTLKAINFAEASGSYTKVFADNGLTTLAINLKHFEAQIEAVEFMRIHRSYVVNLHKIDEFEGNRIFINQKEIPISSSHKEEFLKRFTFL